MAKPKIMYGKVAVYGSDGRSKSIVILSEIARRMNIQLGDYLKIWEHGNKFIITKEGVKLEGDMVLYKSVTVSSRGRFSLSIVIPVHIAELLGVQYGDTLEVWWDGESGLEIRKEKE